MNIVIIAPCVGTYGGVEAYVVALYKAAIAEGCAVRVVFKRVAGFILHETFERVIADEHIPAEFVSRASAALIETIFWADVVHCQNSSPDVVFLCRLLKKSVVLTVHYNGLMPPSLRKLVWAMAAMSADCVIYISRFVMDSWELRNRDKRSIMNHSICELPSGSLPPEKRRGFFFAARWISNKGVEVLINAYQQARIDKSKWPLRMAGTGPIFDAMTKSARFPYGVEVVGFVTQTQKAEMIRSSKWVVVPSHTNEDLGLVPFEARNVQVPCVVTRDGGLPEAGGEQAIVCTPASVDSLRNALEQAASMEDGEYVMRAIATQSEMRTQLRPTTWYVQLYRTLKGEAYCVI
jgi:glycosyltransferase involved in cell wall biosynthesis